MRKGDVPVPYIIALILGIIVVGLLAFWFFVLGGKLPGQTTEGTCNSDINRFCTTWSACAYAVTCNPAGSTAAADWQSYSPSCVSLAKGEPTYYDCRLSQGFLVNGAQCSTDAQCAGGLCDGAPSGTCALR